MCGKNFVCWNWTFLFLVVSSSKFQQNSKNNEEKHYLTARNELDADFTTNYGDKIKTLRYDFHEKSANNAYDMQYDDMQYESRTIFANNDRENDSIHELGMHSIQNHEDDKQVSMKLRMNSTNASHKRNFMSPKIYENLIVKDKNDSTSYEFFENFSKDRNKRHIVSYRACLNVQFNLTCIKFCCHPDKRLIKNTCTSKNITNTKYIFPNVYGYTNDSMQSENKRAKDLFLTDYNVCKEKNCTLLSDKYDFMIIANGSLYLSTVEKFVNLTSYCLFVGEEDKLKVLIYSETYDEIFNTDNNNNVIKMIYVSFHIVSIPLYVSIFVIYSILPELRNEHSFMLRNYSGSLSVAYAIHIVNILIKADTVQYPICIIIAFFTYFFYMASHLWLNVMSINMWWTFRGFCSLQKNVKQSKRNKMIFYAIYAWGLPFIFGIVCIIMDFISEDVPEILQPEFQKGNCWFAKNETFALYYYGFKSICIISSICLSISTALKIVRYEKDTNHCLRDSESRRYDDNKKWFNLYLQLFIVLFIVMGIKWSMMTATWLYGNLSKFSYPINLVDFIESLCIFIIFVWKKKIKRMLLQRFSCDLFSEARRATNTIDISSSRRTSTCTISDEISMEKMNSCEQKN